MAVKMDEYDKLIALGMLVGYKIGFEAGTLLELNNHVAVHENYIKQCKENESEIDFLEENFEYIIDTPGAKVELDSFVKSLGYIKKEN